ncbi:MAG: hypothetical protein ACP5PJ_05635 [Acidimicrobiales bacterium]
MAESHSIDEALASVTSDSYLRSIETLPISDLRVKRDEASWVENLLSYARRVLQARIDIAEVGVEQLESGDVANEVSRVLTEHRGATAPSARWTEVDLSSEDESVAAAWLEALIHSRATQTTGEPTLDELKTAERGISEVRAKLHAVLESISAEVVRRYREGEADVETLLESKK